MIGRDTLDEFPEIWSHYFDKQSSETRNKIVECYMPLAETISAHYYKLRIGGNADYHDYLHNAVVGLIQAIEKYRPTKTAKFTTYASYRIKGQILNSLANISEKNSQLSYISKRKKELLSSFTEAEIEESKIKSNLEDITNFTLNVTYSFLLSESMSNNSDDMENESNAYCDYEIQDIIKTIQKLLGAMHSKKKLVLEYYYFYELNFLEIADILGVTKGRVSQMHKEAVQEIRTLYKKSVELDTLV